MILPCEIPQLDIPDMGRNHILEFFLVPVRKIISVQEIYSLLHFHLASFPEEMLCTCVRPGVSSFAILCPVFLWGPKKDFTW